MVKFEGKIGTLYQIFTPCTPALPLQFRAKKYFFSSFFCFFIITTIFNAQKRFLKFHMMFKRKGGGGERPFEQFSKKLHFS